MSYSYENGLAYMIYNVVQHKNSIFMITNLVNEVVSILWRLIEVQLLFQPLHDNIGILIDAKTFPVQRKKGVSGLSPNCLTL